MKNDFCNRWNKGFTLIELLIVIAIILILIAIALPNFLEAQIRARVTKSKGEMRTYATALESYFIDFQWYPPDHDSRTGTPFAPSDQNGFIYLTTPLSYLTSLPIDPFGANTDNPSGHASIFYEGGSGSDNGACGGFGPYRLGPAFRRNSPRCVHAYLVIGIGPDARDSTGQLNGGSSPVGGCGGNDDFPLDGPNSPICMTSYSPTNGTKSYGDFYAVTGDWRNGWIFWDAQLIGKPR